MTQRTSDRKLLGALLALAVCTTAARAEEPATKKFSLDGFGTLGLAHSSEDRADFTSTIFKPDGAGFSRDWSADVDSLLGVQLTGRFTPRLSAVLQVIAEQNYDGSYRPHVEWANVKYEFTPDLSARAGRIVLPMFMASDVRKVGYTYPWLRLPLEVYGMVPVTNSDGIDLSYRMRARGATNTFQIGAGRSDSELATGALGRATAEARKLLIFSNTLEHRSTTVRFAYERASITIPELLPLFDAFRQFGPEGTAVADRNVVDDRGIEVLTVGVSYNPGAWLVTGEWSRLQADTNVIGERSAWYLAGGHRWGKLTPFLLYSNASADRLSDPGLTLAGLPAPIAEQAGQLNATLNAILSTKPVQSTLSIGLRWEAGKNSAVKVQFDHIDVGAGSSGVLTNLQPGFEAGGEVDVLSAAIDFVF